ncbi:MAG: hypothetical protein ACI87H_001677, partial [Gammaproteobacteria bacterium]
MKTLKLAGSTLFIYLMSMQQALAFFAEQCEPIFGSDGPIPCSNAAPEINAAGAIIAIGLVIGLSALIR